MDYLFIVNPVAGKGNSVKAVSVIQSYCKEKNLDIQIKQTTYPGEAAIIARDAAATSCKGVVAVGGDGTVLETANGLMGTAIPLGILPMGSGNDFARTLNIPLSLKNIRAALDIITTKEPQPVDVGQFSDCSFLNVASIGFDAEIIRDLPRIRRYIKGSAAYVLSVFLKFLTYRTKTVDLTIDGETFTADLFLAAVCNGTCYGGGMQVNPNGSVTDGCFDLVLIKPIPRYKIPVLLGRFQKGLHLTLPYVTTYRCKEVVIEAEESLVVNADGEAAAVTPITFTIKPLAIRVFSA